LLLLPLATPQVVYIYAVFVWDGTQDVVLVKKVERGEIDLRDILFRKCLFDRIGHGLVRDAYLVKNKLAGLPVPDGYEVGACGASNKITADAKIKKIGAQICSMIPHAEISPVFSEGMRCLRRQHTRIEGAIPKC
jgi:hypothetical protein